MSLIILMSHDDSFTILLMLQVVRICWIHYSSSHISDKLIIPAMKSFELVLINQHKTKTGEKLSDLIAMHL